MIDVERLVTVGTVLIAVFLLGAACGESQPAPTATPAAQETPWPTLVPSYATQVAEKRSPEVPALPFPNNPDPSECGIPTQWGKDEPAWLTGRYAGEMVQPTVYLYDSHLRFEVTGKAPHGSEVKIELYQGNPVLDYYFVKTVNTDQVQKGWVPAPFLSLEPVE